MTGFTETEGFKFTGATESDSERIVRYTHEEIDLTGVPMNSPIRELVLKLSCSRSYLDNAIPESIMDYERLKDCDHDDGYLCEHRLQFIVNFLKDNGKEKG